MNATELSNALSTHAEAVCRHYLPNGRKQGRYWICGNARGAPGKSMHVRLAPPGTPGKWTDEATAEHGDLLDIIKISIRAAELRDAMAEAHRFLALPPRPGTPVYSADRDPQTGNIAAAHRLWRQCRAIQGSHAETYLRKRGIALHDQSSLRFHPALLHRSDKFRRRWPAMVAAVIDNAGALKGIHRTWLDPERPIKAVLENPRKALGSIHNHAVRFGTPGPGGILIAGEGIETVLSIVTAVPGVPAAAALSAAHLGGFRPPPHLRRLLIARDADENGATAALRLKRYCARHDIEAIVVEPRLGDFNDDLREYGPEAVARVFTPHTSERIPA